jgi:hypothetical protein
MVLLANCEGSNWGLLAAGGGATMATRRPYSCRGREYEFMSKPLRVLIFLGALGIIAAVMALLASRSGSRGALRRYRAELQAKGEKLTIAELMQGRLTNVVDSHAIITNATARLRSGPITPGLLAPRTYFLPGQANVTWRQPDLRSTIVGASGRMGTWEEFDAQMRAAASPLQEIRAALKEPSPDAGPCTNLLMGRRVNYVSIRVAAQWLAGAAENDLHQGRLEAALQNLEALAGLARMERNEPTLVAQMIRVAVTGLGLATMWDALQAPGWTEAQLERLQRAWEPVDLVAAVERGFLSGRAWGYELFTHLRHSRAPQASEMFRPFGFGGSSSAPWKFADVWMDYVYLPAYKLTSIDEDELFHLRCSQESLELLRSLKAHRPWPEAKQGLANVGASISKVSSSPQHFRYLVSMIAIPNYLKAGVTAVNAETERQMTLAAIALMRCQLRHGKLPSSLEALVPEFLAAVPWDYMSARPFCYRLKEDGSYGLYSVGLDGKDDGGDPTPRPGSTPGLWEGRDAVWPSPAVD